MTKIYVSRNTLLLLTACVLFPVACSYSTKTVSKNRIEEMVDTVGEIHTREAALGFLQSVMRNDQIARDTGSYADVSGIHYNSHDTVMTRPGKFSEISYYIHWTDIVWITAKEPKDSGRDWFCYVWFRNPVLDKRGYDSYPFHIYSEKAMVNCAAALKTLTNSQFADDLFSQDPVRK